MPAPKQLVHIPVLHLTAAIRGDLTPACIARVLADLRADVDAAQARAAARRDRGRP